MNDFTSVYNNTYPHSKLSWLRPTTDFITFGKYVLVWQCGRHGYGMYYSEIGWPIRLLSWLLAFLWDSFGYVCLYGHARVDKH